MRYYKRVTIEGVTNGLIMRTQVIDAATGIGEDAPITSVYKTFDELVVGLADALLSGPEAKRIKQLFGVTE